MQKGLHFCVGARVCEHAARLLVHLFGRVQAPLSGGLRQLLIRERIPETERKTLCHLESIRNSRSPSPCPALQSEIEETRRLQGQQHHPFDGVLELRCFLELAEDEDALLFFG